MNREKTMKTRMNWKSVPVLILAAVLMAAWSYPVLAQSKRQDRPGGDHGELDFPISWKRYYGYVE